MEGSDVPDARSEVTSQASDNSAQHAADTVEHPAPQTGTSRDTGQDANTDLGNKASSGAVGDTVEHPAPQTGTSRDTGQDANTDLGNKASSGAVGDKPGQNATATEEGEARNVANKGDGSNLPKQPVAGDAKTEPPYWKKATAAAVMSIGLSFGASDASAVGSRLDQTVTTREAGIDAGSHAVSAARTAESKAPATEHGSKLSDDSSADTEVSVETSKDKPAGSETISEIETVLSALPPTTGVTPKDLAGLTEGQAEEVLQETKKELDKELTEEVYEAMNREQEEKELQEAKRDAGTREKRAAEAETWAEARARTESLERNKQKRAR